ncbi:NADPH-dependent FMN reductase [Staphylococcus simulans]|uniref:NADPH-dependent FMN reductase n=1 Tax=Staphylococcus simulans TaxID=1286 RepID=UPI000D03240D|nr:NADPH-dependent FMN reductase [Staphylococcus simulans]
MKNIGFISGSLREASYNKAIINSMLEAAPEDWNTYIIDFKDLPVYNFDIEGENEPEAVTAFREKIRESDGVIIVSPEYNSGIPGGLKNAIDWASRSRTPDEKPPLIWKPFAVAGGSPGAIGTALGQMQIRQSLLAMNAHVMTGPKFIVGKVHEKVNTDTMRLEDERTLKRIPSFLKAFDTWVDQFKK